MSRFHNIFSYIIFPLLLISVIIPVSVRFGRFADFASMRIYLYDFIVLLIVVYAGLSVLIGNFKLSLSHPMMSTVQILLVGWMLISIISNFIGGENILVSSIWMLKYLEVVILFFAIQIISTNTEYIGREPISKAILTSGFFLSIGHIIKYIITNPSHRPRFIFENPNAMAIMLAFIASFAIVDYIYQQSRYKYISALLLITSVVGLAITGSRSGFLALAVGIGVITLVTTEVNNVISRGKLFAFTIGGVSLLSLILIRLNSRLINWIDVSSSGISISNEGGATAILTRIDLITKAIELFLEKPLLGYGWFASPSRVGWLDIHYTTLLVEVGLIGALIFIYSYFLFARLFFQDYLYTGGKFPLIGLGLICGQIFGNIGGNFLRYPKFLIIVFTLLVLSEFYTRKEINSSTD